MANENAKPVPIDARCMNDPKEGDQLFMVFWERMANSGQYLMWAKDVSIVVRYCYPGSYVKSIIVKVDPADMPVQLGVAA